MKLAAFIFTARFWLTLMVSMTMGMSTAAADIHPPDPDEIACEDSRALAAHNANTVNIVGSASDHPDGDEPQRDHDHHAHSCGTCHVHLVGTQIATLSTGFPGDPNLYLGADQTVPRAGPFGLFRPPRA